MVVWAAGHDKFAATLDNLHAQGWELTHYSMSIRPWAARPLVHHAAAGSVDTNRPD